MLKLFGGGGGGNGEGKTWQGKSFRIEHYHVTVEDVLAEGISTHMYIALRINIPLCLSTAAVYTLDCLRVYFVTSLSTYDTMWITGYMCTDV